MNENSSQGTLVEHLYRLEPNNASFLFRDFASEIVERIDKAHRWTETGTSHFKRKLCRSFLIYDGFRVARVVVGFPSNTCPVIFSKRNCYKTT